MNKERRSKIRTELLSETVIIETLDTQEYYRKVKNISESGIYVENIVLKPNELINVIFTLPGDLGKLNLKGIVKRSNWAKTKKRSQGVGIEFCEMSKGSRQILDAYIKYVKNKQIIAVSRRVIEEFFGKRPPL